MRFRTRAVVAIATSIACVVACQSPSKSITADPALSCSCPACPTTATSTSSTPFDLPKAAVGDDPSVPAILSVTLDAHGNVGVAGVPVADDTALVAAVSKFDPGTTRVVITADASAKHGSVIHVIDVLKSRGFARFAFGVAWVPPSPVATP
jgi:biopolymer transport protein ExbD